MGVVYVDADWRVTTQCNYYGALSPE